MSRFSDRSVKKITTVVRHVLKNRGRRDFRSNPRLVGSGNIIRRAKTQEAAQADLNISVKLLDTDGNVTGDPFDAAFIDADGVTAADSALPRVAISKNILITKIDGSWYVVNPTLIKSTTGCS